MKISVERDILLKVTGKGFDLDLVTVDEFMTVLELVRTVVDKDIIAYSDAVTKK